MGEEVCVGVPEREAVFVGVLDWVDVLDGVPEDVIDREAVILAVSVGVPV